jgi:hypothetical protein
LHTAIQAEVSSFITEHAHLLDEAGLLICTES